MKKQRKEKWGAPIDVSDKTIIEAVGTLLGKARRHYRQLCLSVASGGRLVARDRSGGLHLVKGVGAASYPAFRARLQVMTGTIDLGPLPDDVRVAEGRIPKKTELGAGYGHGPFQVTVWPESVVVKAA